jgi:hypothetical protein
VDIIEFGLKVNNRMENTTLLNAKRDVNSQNGEDGVIELRKQIK